MLSAVHVYRISNRLMRWRVPILPRIADYFARVVFACWVPHSASIGKGVVLGYGGLGIVIHKDAVIGDGCHIDQGVTIGGNAVEAGVPSIGKRVYIGAGAKILGRINIGNDVVVGANAVVIRYVEDNAVVVGVPARVVRLNAGGILDDQGRVR